MPDAFVAFGDEEITIGIVLEKVLLGVRLGVLVTEEVAVTEGVLSADAVHDEL